jgi:hypothetical protein
MTTAGVLVGWVFATLGGLASVATLFQVGSERRKIVADARRAGVADTQVLTSIAVSLLQPSQNQIVFLRRELAAAQGTNTTLRSEIARLRAEGARGARTEGARSL